MTLYDIIFLLMFLLSALGGIGLGFHVAYRLADTKNDDYDNGRTRHTNPPKKPVKNSNGKKERNKTRIGETGKLKERVNSSAKRMSYSEFDCQFTGEDHKSKLNRIREKQDSAYNCLEDRVNEQ